MQSNTEKDKLEEAKRLCIKHFLIPFEGEGTKDSNGNFIAYLDPVGIPTVAWGFTYNEDNSKVKLGDIWSYDRAVKHKNKILDNYLKEILKFSSKLIEESPNRIAAVLSWVYNLGIGNYLASTFKKKIDSKDWETAFSECRRWDKAGGKVLKGLTRRREAEGLVLLLDSFGTSENCN